MDACTSVAIRRRNALLTSFNRVDPEEQRKRQDAQDIAEATALLKSGKLKVRRTIPAVTLQAGQRFSRIGADNWWYVEAAQKVGDGIAVFCYKPLVKERLKTSFAFKPTDDVEISA